MTRHSLGPGSTPWANEVERRISILERKPFDPALVGAAGQSEVLALGSGFKRVDYRSVIEDIGAVEQEIPLGDMSGPEGAEFAIVLAFYAHVAVFASTLPVGEDYAPDVSILGGNDTHSWGVILDSYPWLHERGMTIIRASTLSLTALYRPENVQSGRLYAEISVGWL